jgi:peptidoglycan lytic transglycosylase
MNRLPLLLAFLLTFFLVSCGTTFSKKSKSGQSEHGMAAYYSDKLHGRKTASGDLYDKKAMTAAHPSLPFNTMVRVTNLSNRQSVVVRINDRGPFGNRRRIIDLSREAAKRIDMIRAGVVEVRVEIISIP